MTTLGPQQPILYLITSGTTTVQTTPNDQAFLEILSLIKVAVAARFSLIQIREKQLSTRVLFELARQAVRLAEKSATKIIVNDRFDVALAAGADGVQLTGESLSAAIVRESSSRKFIIGCSVHSLEEAHASRSGGADFVLYGPVYETPSKSGFGKPQGVEKLQKVAGDLVGFPVIAIGGISLDRVTECFLASASGIAAITLFSDPKSLPSVADEIVKRHADVSRQAHK